MKSGKPASGFSGHRIDASASMGRTWGPFVGVRVDLERAEEQPFLRVDAHVSASQREAVLVQGLSRGPVELVLRLLVVDDPVCLDEAGDADRRVSSLSLLFLERCPELVERRPFPRHLGPQQVVLRRGRRRWRGGGSRGGLHRGRRGFLRGKSSARALAASVAARSAPGSARYRIDYGLRGRGRRRSRGA